MVPRKNKDNIHLSTAKEQIMSKYLATLNIKEFFSLPSHMCENSIVDNAFCEVGSKDEK